MRNILATLLLSQGTPMLLSGDEFARTQQGNNNAYCQDNRISWVSWEISEAGQALIRFVKKLTALRRKYPILRRSRFLSGITNEQIGIKEVTWINASGLEMQDEQWHDDLMLCFGMMLDGRAQATGIRQRGQDATILVIFNAYHDVVQFTLPGSTDAAHWLLLIDTNQPVDLAKAAFEPGDVYQVTGRSLLMFSIEAETERAKDDVKPRPPAAPAHPPGARRTNDTRSS
jgi:glycogen operon protein